MALTRTSMFLKAKEILRVHPDWTDEEVALAADIRPVDIDVVRTARKDLEAG